MADASPGEGSDEPIVPLKRVFDSYETMAIATAAEGEPWIAKVYFADDVPGEGSLDICCALILTSKKLAALTTDPRVAFLVAGDAPDRWVQGFGRAEVIEDETDQATVAQRLNDKTQATVGFLALVPWRAVRIHVERAKLTDLTREPPIEEFTFRPVRSLPAG